MAADAEITDLPLGNQIDSGDEFVYVDSSDTTATLEGTTKRIDWDVIVTEMILEDVFADNVLTTKGDLYTFDSDNQRLAIGANGQVLIADSAEATGMKWGAAGAGTTINPTDLNLPVRSDSNTFVDSLLRHSTTTGVLVSDAGLIIYKSPTVSEVNSIGLLVEADGTLVWVGTTGGLLAVIDDKDNELWTASDVSGNPIGFINADWLVQFGNPFNRPFELVYNNTTGKTDWFFNAVRYNMLQLVDFADDTAAGVGGLATGDLYRTTSTKAIAVKD